MCGIKKVQPFLRNLWVKEMQLATVNKTQEGRISANLYIILSIDIEGKYSDSETQWNWVEFIDRKICKINSLSNNNYCYLWKEMTLRKMVFCSGISNWCLHGINKEGWFVY